jgi:hypothetical protein
MDAIVSRQELANLGDSGAVLRRHGYLGWYKRQARLV